MLFVCVKLFRKKKKKIKKSKITPDNLIHYTTHLHFHKACGSLLNHVPYVPCLPEWSTYRRANVQNVCQLLILTLQRANKRANVPKVCQLFNLVSQHTKDEPIFQLCLPKGLPVFQIFFKEIFQFLNFSIKLNICKFQEYLRNSRKLISRNKEFKF